MTNVLNVSELIQIDGASYNDALDGIIGRDGEQKHRSVKAAMAEEIAEARVLKAEESLMEHILDEDNRLNNSKWNAEDNVARQAAYYQKHIDPDAGVQNTAAILAAAECKAYFSKAATEKWYFGRLKDLKKRLDEAEENREDVLAWLDTEAQRLELGEFNDKVEQAFAREAWKNDAQLEKEMYEAEFPYMSHEDLISYFSCSSDTIRHKDNIKFLDLEFKNRFVESLMGQFKAMRTRHKLTNDAWEDFCDHVNYAWRGNKDPGKYYTSREAFYYRLYRGESYKKNPSVLDNKGAAIKMHYDNMNKWIKEISQLLETLENKKAEKKAKKEAEFWERQESMEIEVVRGEDYWWDDGKGGYLEGSCTDVSFRPVNPYLIAGETGVYWDVRNHADNTRGHYSMTEDIVIEKVDEAREFNKDRELYRQGLLEWCL